MVKANGSENRDARQIREVAVRSDQFNLEVTRSGIDDRIRHCQFVPDAEFGAFHSQIIIECRDRASQCVAPVRAAPISCH